MKSTPYSKQFFTHREPATRRSAQTVVPLLLSLTGAQSVVDIGCGIGTWLSVFKQHGVNTVMGLDGDWVPREELRVPPDNFSVADLARPLVVNRRFDLALCLEVAEHLPAESGPSLVRDLCALSDIVLFSAAIPQQGGTGHLNERWQSFWLEQFRSYQFTAIDCIRPSIWDNHQVEWWYRQNMLLYVASKALSRYPKLNEGRGSLHPGPTNLVHPVLLELKAAEIERLRQRIESSWLRRMLSRVRRSDRDA